MATNAFQALEDLQAAINNLNTIIQGGESDSVTLDGVSVPSVRKSIADAYAQIQTMVEGQIPYTTLALAQAAGEPPLDNNGYHKLVRVVGDATNTNNGVYYWSGSGLVKSDYDPIETASSAKAAVDSIKSQITVLSVALYGAIVAVGGSAVSGQSYIIEDQIETDGTVKSVTIETLTTGTLYVGVYRESAVNSFNRVGVATVSITATGVQTIDLLSENLVVQAGDRLAFGGPISYFSGVGSTGWRGIGLNATSATTSSINTSSTINCSAEIAYEIVAASASAMAVRDELISSVQASAEAAAVTASLVSDRVTSLENVFSDTASVVIGNEAKTGSAVSALSFALENSLPAGALDSVNFYSLSAGTVTIGLYSLVGNTFTRKWYKSVTVSGAGEQTVDLTEDAVSVEDGDRIAFAGQITYESVASAGFRQFPTNAATATVSTVVKTSTVLANATIRLTNYFITKTDYAALKARVDGALFDLKTVDRIVTVGDSYSEAIGVLKNKSYTMRVSALSDYNFSNFAQGGRTAATTMADILAGTTRFGAAFPSWNAKYATIALNENDKNGSGLTDEEYFAALADLVAVVRQQGVEPIICTEWGGDGAFTQDGDQRNLSGLKALAKSLGVGFVDVVSDGRVFNVAQHADFWKSNHPATRTMYLMADPIRRGVHQLLPLRPRQSIKIFRARDSVSVAADAVFASLLERNQYWQEISIGHTALSETEKLKYDTATSLYAGTQSVADEYLQIMNGTAVSMGALALLDIVVPVVGGDYAIDLSDSVFDTADVLTVTTNGLEWLSATVSDGVVSVPASSVRGDKISLLLTHATDVQISGVSVTTESGVKKQSTTAVSGAVLGTESLSQTLLDSAALADWTTTGTVTAISPADDCLPYGTTGCVTVSESNTISQQLSISAEPRARRAHVEVWARRWIDKFDPASDFSTAPVTYESWDERTIRVVQSVPGGGSIAVHEDAVGLWWTRLQFETVIPSFVQQSIEISCPDGELQVAFASVVV